MNISSLLGFIGAGLIVFFGAIHSAKNPAIFLDSHAILLVVGGTLAATLIAYPISQLKDLGSFLIYGVILKKKTNYLKIIEDIRQIKNSFQSNGQVHLSQIHPFLAEGVGLLQKDYLDREELNEVLKSRKQAFKSKYSQDAKILNAMAKYPPAFGLLGASTGMISMMTNLGGDGGTASIGAAMAVALVATFWGIAAANFIFLPLADYAQRVIQVDQELRGLIADGILMIHEGVKDEVMAERLRSRLDLDDRYKVVRKNRSLHVIAKDRYETSPKFNHVKKASGE
jgi:chemotaxis protein MotA